MLRNVTPIALVFAVATMVPARGPSRSGRALSSVGGGIPLEAVLRENGCLDQAAPARDNAWPPGWDTLTMAGGDVPPARVVRDPYPTFHGVAVDTKNDIVVMSDSNRHGLWMYPRTVGSLTAKEAAAPLAGIRGPATGMMFVATVALDPERREMYTVDNDIGDRLETFSYDQIGNVKPIRVLDVPHQAWGIALSPKRNEVAVTVESSRVVVVYRRGSKDQDLPIRVLRGPSTGLGDPHGVGFDDEHDELVVVNHGNVTSGATRREMKTDESDKARSGRRADDNWQGGRWELPSITIFKADAGGDAAPVRRIQGARTGLNWPMGVSIDAAHGEVAVANNGDSSVRIFSRTATGDTAPLRVIKGPRTGISGPMGISVDAQNDEIWVSNYGEHSAVVFDRMANGNVTPKRIVRNAPEGAPTSGFGNPGAVAYDSKRNEILVPN
jgi:DNA-binding beta-propeller fold protein YncE